jgi:hypothetical protein
MLADGDSHIGRKFGGKFRNQEFWLQWTVELA